MAIKALQVIESAYRGTLEEQDDTVVWLTHAMKGAGAELDVLLIGNSVNYCVKGQDSSGLSFGARKQTQPPDVAQDLAGLVGKGVNVHVCQEDLARRGIEGDVLMDGVKKISRSQFPKLFAGYDHVWHW